VLSVFGLVQFCLWDPFGNLNILFSYLFVRVSDFVLEDLLTIKEVGISDKNLEGTVGSYVPLNPLLNALVRYNFFSARVSPS